ncbi:TetR/AcrR family transcriptional regulator [Pseudovibrio sp. Tun.PSC04-5.I4]|uniref:TetR/AcrR family transcriptional regulator n=1 Tax=Pseudovibrio sp. Tun.PSC04-5.I4 TaxID=1798213 RepID=UPI00087FEA9F|nr:TetR/AcrR family transcriptional regulator [Pseudovibrio sp. Tun.PSC04-5.I4]SDQ72934.1 DNA-binding transcriptional regulator, AcrR family [Pseudovibrio sp. Tun.PSC04-5.I4]
MSIPLQNTTKDKLLEAAVRVLNVHPGASLADVALRAGVKRVTLHRVIGTREDLLRELALRSLAQTDAACQHAVIGKAKSIDQLKAIVAALVPHAENCHFLWKNPDICDDPEIARDVKHHEKVLLTLIERVITEGHIQPSLSPKWVMASLDAVLYAAATTARQEDMPMEEASSLAVQTLFGGIKA